MPVLVIPPNLKSSDPKLVARTADLNVEGGMIDSIMDGIKPRPIARYVNSKDIPNPPAPAWYLPDANDIYIHVDEAGIKHVPEVALYPGVSTEDVNYARILGLYCHEAGHAAISDHMTPVQMGAMHHGDLLTLLEELRVENYALRRQPNARRFLRASFALVLENLPDEFETKSHVVRAWAIARGRTLAGVAAPDETEAVDIAARTLLGDDTVDALTDLLQEALTLRLEHAESKTRMVEICDEWVELVGESAEATGCTHCAREAKDGEEPTGTMSGPAKPDEESDDGEAADGGDPTDEETDGDDSPPPEAISSGTGDPEGGEFESGTWGTPGGDYEEGDPDDGGADALTDEDAELMAMLARDLADLMTEEWTRDDTGTELAKSGEWAAKVFGSRKQSKRITQSEPTTAMRQHVVKVSQALSALSLPTITKTAKSTEVPPGRLRSREALRASAERAQGRMVTARPWKGTVRRHANARPLVIGIATDTSGSMRWAETGVAEFAYVYTNAGHRIGARTAAVTFGDQVHRICRPGEVMTHVQRKSASDSTEQFDWAMAALDGVLHLTAPAYAARILLVISDGALVKGGESARAAEWLRRMDKAGTHVLWISDRDIDGYSMWLPRLAKQLDRLTLVTAEGGGYRRGVADKPVFDLLNEAALKAITTNVL
jgi:hypothetical protein